MYKLIKALEVLACSVKAITLKAANPKSIRISLPFYGETPPSLKLRNNGKIHIGAIKTRCSLRVFSDGGKVEIKDGCFFNNNCSINSMTSITIGENTIFGENVKIYDHDHIFDESTGVNKSQFKCSPISIGKNCWIGSNVIILKGVDICDNVLIAAGSTVTHSITQSGVYVPQSGPLRRIERRK